MGVADVVDRAELVALGAEHIPARLDLAAGNLIELIHAQRPMQEQDRAVQMSDNVTPTIASVRSPFDESRPRSAACLSGADRVACRA
jgi:hypothetical protein